MGNLKDLIFNAVFYLMGWIVVLVAGLIIFYFYNQEFFEQYIGALAAVFFYIMGMSWAVWYRSKKEHIAKNGGDPTEVTLYITYYDMLKYDLAMFLTPLVILIASYLLKGSIGSYEIVYSGIAFIGLYVAGKMIKI